MQDYPWAQNKQKLARVIGQNPHGTEAEHLEAYRKTLGVVIESEVPKAKEEVKEEKTEEVTEKPKKKTK